MKKFYITLVVILIALAGFGFYSYYGFHKTGDASEHFAVDSIAAIAKAWDPKVFEERADPGLVKAMNGPSGQGVAQLFTAYRSLGALTKPPECEAINTAKLIVHDEEYTATTYHCTAEYESNTTKINITVRKGESHPAWEIYYMKIEALGTED